MCTQTNVHLADFFLALVLPAGVFDTRPADYVFMLLFNWICIVVSFVCLRKAEHFNLTTCIVFHPQMFVTPRRNVASLFASIVRHHWLSLPAAAAFYMPAFSSAAMCRVTVALRQWRSLIPLLQSTKTNLGHTLHRHKVSLWDISGFMTKIKGKFCKFNSSFTTHREAVELVAWILMFSLCVTIQTHVIDLNCRCRLLEC